MFHVTLTVKGQPPTYLTIPKKQVTVGRVQGNDIVLPKGNVSRHHFRCDWRPDGVWIVDLKSTGGTFVNQQKVTSQRITKADKVLPGDFVLQFEGLFEESQEDASEGELSEIHDPHCPTARLESIAPRSIAARRVLASRADAQAALLQKLSEGYDLKVLEALTQNPATPPPALFSLGAYFPEALWSNPALPLLLLESEAYSLFAASPALPALCALPSVSVRFLRLWLEAPAETLIAVIRSPAATRELLEEIYARGGTSTRVLCALLASPRITPELVRTIHQQETSDPESIQLAVIRSPNVPRELIRELCGRSDTSAMVRWTLEQHLEYQKLSQPAPAMIIHPFRQSEVSITIRERGALVSSWVLTKAKTTIGRVPGNDLVLPRGNISKQHCTLSFQDGGLWVEDLRSINGTFLNGQKLIERRALQEHDKLQLGDFVLEVEGSP